MTRFVGQSLVIGLGAVLVLLIWLLSSHSGPAGIPADIPDSKLAGYDVVHLRKSGCPSGFVVVEGLFALGERRYAGCVRKPRRGGAIDYLLPGESVEIGVELEMQR